MQARCFSRVLCAASRDGCTMVVVAQATRREASIGECALLDSDFFLCTRGVLTALSCVVAVANANRSNVSRNVLAAGIPHQRGVVPCSWAHLPETRGEGERTAPDVRESAPLGPVRRTCSNVASRRCFVYSNKHGPSNGKAPAVPASSQNKRRGGNKHVEEEDHSTVGFNLPDTVPAIVDVLHQKLPF